ncbi:MAG TPA: AAA family ATPase [Actinobacteria bacterium]|nr:AAA family ATPase [Actinomycetota bacterium]
MTTLTEQAADAAIVAAATTLALPTVRTQAAQIADAAARDQLTHRGYLAELLSTEVDDRAERRRIRRIREARFPRLKHLAEFDTAITPIDPATIATLTTGAFIDAGTPVVFLGDPGTGKTHLLIGTGLAACHTGRSVRYITAAGLVNELVEAQDEHTLTRLIGRYGRLDLLLIDELGYLHLDPRGAELLFQVITEREERASIAVATNAPFSKAHRFEGTCACWHLMFTGSRR